MARKQTTTTKEERDERLAQLRGTIAEAAKTLADDLAHGTSDHLKAVLAFGARFHHYSFGNQMLIMSQRPDATRVASYKAWEKLGYHVAKGERAIRILAPRTYSTERENKETGELEVRSGLFFVAVPVFDASQLDADEVAAKPLPSFWSGGYTDEQVEALIIEAEAAIRAEGITLVEATDLGSAQGSSGGGRIRIKVGLAGTRRLDTLTHEWAHELLHWGAAKHLDGAYSPEQRECHAEASAFVVMAHFGIHNDIASDYLRSWGQTPETLLAELSMVQKAAAHIIEALEGHKSADADDDASETVAA